MTGSGRRHRAPLAALVGFGVALIVPVGASAQIERYSLRFDGNFPPDAALGSGEGTGHVVSFTLENVLIDTTIDMMSADVVVSPDTPLSPDALEAFASELGFRILELEAVALGVAQGGDAGWTFTLPDGATFPLDVPESHLLVSQLAAAGETPQRLRVLLYRDGTGGWHMSWLPD